MSAAGNQVLFFIIYAPLYKNASYKNKTLLRRLCEPAFGSLHCERGCCCGPIEEGELAKGAFYKPTLLEINDEQLPIAQQEVFGPVAVLQVFETEQEAIKLANNSEYGLAASIWTRDVDRPWRIAGALEAGTIWINTYARVFPQFEEGGYKHSGIGRLNGEAALETFLEYKHISFNPGSCTIEEK